jgi:hypothetical protein
MLGQTDVPTSSDGGQMTLTPRLRWQHSASARALTLARQKETYSGHFDSATASTAGSAAISKVQKSNLTRARSMTSNHGLADIPMMLDLARHTSNVGHVKLAKRDHPHTLQTFILFGHGQLLGVETDACSVTSKA